ncbi:MAG: ATP-binding protein [bacterium]
MFSIIRKMTKEIVLQHKLEKERLLSKDYIEREKLDFGRKYLDSSLIKIVTGPRRAGKSVFSLLLLKDKDFAYINFDDEAILKIKDYDEILKSIHEVYPQTNIILFDEIQNLPDWELFVNKLQRRGFNLVLTGSNARLLSQEMSNRLTGRYIPIEIFPFNFREVLRAKELKVGEEEFNLPEVKGRILNYLDDYLKKGGFPEVVVTNLEPRIYLQTLFDAILLRDIVKRYNIRFSQKIYELSLYLTANFCNEFSFKRLTNILEFRSTNTLQNYLRYLEETYLFFPLNRFSFKMQEVIKTPKKIYLVDNGFIPLLSSQNLGRLMENLVMTECLRRGFKSNENLFYYKTRNNKEVDFVLKEGLKIKGLIQVCYEMDNSLIRERELKALVEASNDLNCNELLVITWDYKTQEKFKDKMIRFIPLWKWLLE